MATGGPPSAQPGHPVTSPTDCPLCGSLCLGPVILPCRDVICRKCLHDMLQERGLQLACQQCGQHLDTPRHRKVTVTDLAEQMGTDPVLERLVIQELNKATDVQCLYCPNKQAANVCLDCQEYYCDVCSANHCKGRVSRDHVLHQLSQALQNSPAAARATPTSSSGCSSAMSTSSLDSIRNLPDPQSGQRSWGVKEWNEWVRKQMDLLQEASRGKLKVKTILLDILSLGQELLNGVLADEEILDAYQHFLPRFNIIQRTDTGIYVIQETGSDVSTKVKTEALERRLCGVRQGRHCPDPDAVETIRTQLDQLLHLADPDSPDLTSTTPVGSPTSSSTHTPIQRTDTGIYVIQETGSDVSTEVKTEALERRLCGVRQGRHCPDPDAVETIRTQLDQLLHLADPDSADLTSTTPVGLPTSSSTHTPTSAQLPPATPTTIHTFTPTVDVMTATPQRLFTTSPTTADDREKPWITAIVCLPNDTLVMANCDNNKVKVMGLAPPHTVSASLTLSETPRRLALLPDGLVAVTTDSPLIYLIKVTDTLTVTSWIKTVRAYVGVAGQGDGRLLVSCEEDGDGPAAVQVLTRQGDVVRSVTDSTRLTGLNTPFYICDDGDNHVLVSDYWTDLVHRVEVSSGHVTHTYDHTDLRFPAQVCADRAGVIYIASWGGRCVLVRNKGEQWRRLLTSNLSVPGYVGPRGLCLTRTGRLVVTWDRSGSDSVVGVYDLV